MRRWDRQKLGFKHIHFQEILFLLVQVIFSDEQSMSHSTSKIVDFDALRETKSIINYELP